MKSWVQLNTCLESLSEPCLKGHHLLSVWTESLHSGLELRTARNDLILFLSYIILSYIIWSVIVRSRFAIMWLVGISYFQGSLDLACWKINWFLSFLKNNIILYWFLGIFPSCTPVPLTSSFSISAPHHRSIPPLKENPPKINFKKGKERKPSLLLFFPHLSNTFSFIIVTLGDVVYDTLYPFCPVNPTHKCSLW